MSLLWCSAIAGGVRIAVQVMPNAKKSEVLGLQGDAIKIRLQAPALEGRANEALIRFLAEALHLPRSAVSITHGHSNKRKLLALTGKTLSVEQVQAALLPSPD